MKRAFLQNSMRGKRLGQVEIANAIIAEYQTDGYMLTVRQLYYQHVARGLIPNTPKSYKQLCGVINDGRLFGLIDWDAIEDRTRSLASLPTWETPVNIVEACAAQFKIDLWANQSSRVEVYVEKEALEGVVERECNALRVPFLSCRGYTSQSAMHDAGLRLKAHVEDGQGVVILHLGDHDPSGVDMSRDIQERLALFMGTAAGGLTFKRIALNIDQVEAYKPPPNPAKLTDSRCASYSKRFGNKSWELDALPPDVLSGLIREHVDQYRDVTRWGAGIRVEAQHRARLSNVARRWDELADIAEASP